MKESVDVIWEVVFSFKYAKGIKCRKELNREKEEKKKGILVILCPLQSECAEWPTPLFTAFYLPIAQIWSFVFILVCTTDCVQDLLREQNVVYLAHCGAST